MSNQGDPKVISFALLLRKTAATSQEVFLPSKLNRYARRGLVKLDRKRGVIRFEHDTNKSR